MIVVHLDAVSLARVRLAVSPASEAISWLRLTATNNRHPIFGDPGPAARTALREPDVALLTEVPFPGGRIPPRVRRAVDDGSFARRAATGLHRFWRATIAEQWGQLKETLDVDLAQRASTLAGAGLGRVLGSLHRQVRWTGTELHILKPYPDVCHLNGAELVLAPSALAWPRMYAQVCDPRDAVLIYPAASLAATPRPEPGLPRLLGASRAAVLGDLDVARSTHELSRRVLYRRNDRGDALLNSG